MTTVANIAENVGKLGDKNVLPLYFEGHALYCRKCLTGEQAGNDFWDRHLDGIILPQQTADKSLIVEVLAIGPRVGEPCSKEHRRFHKRPKCLSAAVKVGDLLICPNMHPTKIQVSPLAEYEFFIEESCPLAIYTKE